jgi:hypothetical protein
MVGRQTNAAHAAPTAAIASSVIFQRLDTELLPSS